MKEHMEIIIPVKSNNRKDFFGKTADHGHYLDTSNQCVSFIAAQLNHLNIPFYKEINGTVYESVKNAYDAYAKAGLNNGGLFKIEVVVKKKDDTLIIKIKDNGAGFPKRDKRVIFDAEEVLPEGKPKLGYLGGMGIGIKLSKTTLSDKGITLRFKNRKSAGAAAYLFFSKKSMTQDIPVLEPKEEKNNCIIS